MDVSAGFSFLEMSNRVARVRAEMAELGLTALIISDASNVRYLTGFRGEPRSVFLTDEVLVLYTSFRSLAWAERQCSVLGPVIVLKDESDPLGDIGKMLCPDDKVGIDDKTSHAAFIDLKVRLSSCELIPSVVIEKVRRIKSPAELALMEQSQLLTEAIFNAVLPQIRLGMSERAVQGLILAEMAANEMVDRYSFIPIVAFGGNAWEIHHLPDDTVITNDQMLLIDLGVFHQGYASDMTRTLCLGQATEQMSEIYETVRYAQKAAIEAMKPGSGTHEIDQIARSVISEAGHGRSFTHGLGHSIGLETHDPELNLSQSVPDVILEEGMVFTVEPGIYLENGFGVRTEDVVVVTAEGTRRLTRQPLDLIELSC